MKRMLNLYDFDITALLACYKYVHRHETVYGYGWFKPRFWQEQKLVRKLENRDSRSVYFSDREIGIMCNWMERAILGKYDNDSSLFGYERRMYTLLKSNEPVQA